MNNLVINQVELDEVSFCLSESKGGYRNTVLDTECLRWTEIIDKFKEPSIGTKDGSYFLRGECEGRRRNNGIKEVTFIILDGDSSFDPETKKMVSGAPNLLLTAKALDALGFTYLMYTTHSHQTTDKKTGKSKGDRYRVVIPTTGFDPKNLTPIVKYITSHLWDKGVNIVDVKENHTLAQPWFNSRIESSDSPFEFYEKENGLYYYEDDFTHPLRLLDVEKTLKNYQPSEEEEKDKKARKSKAKHPHTKGGSSFYDQVRDYLSIHEILDMAEFEYQSTTPDSEGGAVTRYTPPNYDGDSGGIIVFNNPDGSEMLFSHHATPEHLSNGRHSMDAVDVYCRLNGNRKRQEDNPDATNELSDIVKVRRFKELDGRFVVVRGGHKGKGLDIITIKQLEQGDIRIQETNLSNISDIYNEEPPVFSLKYEKNEFKLKGECVFKSWFYAGRIKAVNGEVRESTKRLDGLRIIPCSLGEVEKITRVTDDDMFNEFKGYPCQPKESTSKEVSNGVQFVLFYLIHVVCSGITSNFNQFWGFLAHMVQKPQERPQWGVILRGGRGTGKSSVHKLLEKILGDDNFLFWDKGIDVLTNNNFNMECYGKLAIFVDDISRPKKGTNFIPFIAALQVLITSEKGIFEPKYIDKFLSKIFARMFFTTNFDSSIPISQEERRFLILDLLGWLAKNQWFFGLLREALSSQNVINALAYLLLNTDLDAIGFDQGGCIDTPGISRAKASSFDTSPTNRWFSGLLKRGKFYSDAWMELKDNCETDDDDWLFGKSLGDVPKKVFQEDFATWAGKKDVDDLSPRDRIDIGTTIKKFTKAKVGGKGNSKYTDIPSRCVAIKAFEDEMGVALDVAHVTDIGYKTRTADVVDTQDYNKEDLAWGRIIGKLKKLKIEINQENMKKMMRICHKYPNAYKGKNLSEGGSKYEERMCQKEIAFIAYPLLEDISEGRTHLEVNIPLKKTEKG